MSWHPMINPEPPTSPGNIRPPDGGKTNNNDEQNKQTVQGRIYFQQQLLNTSYDPTTTIGVIDLISILQQNKRKRKT